MCAGYGATAPFPSLELLSVAGAMPSSLRLGPGAVALVTRLAPFPITLLGLVYSRDLGEEPGINVASAQKNTRAILTLT